MTREKIFMYDMIYLSFILSVKKRDPSEFFSMYLAITLQGTKRYDKTLYSKL